MKNLSDAAAPADVLTRNEHAPPLAPLQVILYLFRVWLATLVVFGFGVILTYLRSAWLLDPIQWRWLISIVFVIAPVGGVACWVYLWLLYYGPMYRKLMSWVAGAPISRVECTKLYEDALRMPWRVAILASTMITIGTAIGIVIMRVAVEMPWVEVLKALPIIPLVCGMCGSFGYFGTIRGWYPVAVWCSAQLKVPRPLRGVSLGVKFFAVTWVSAIAAVCFLPPAAYTLGQTITEQYLRDRALTQLRAAAARISIVTPPSERMKILHEAVMGAHGYVFVAGTAEGRIETPHALRYTSLSQERLFQRHREFWAGDEGTLIDRVGEHRIITFLRISDPPWTLVSVSFPDDFSAPLRRFVFFSLFVTAEILCLVFLFARYYTRGLTTPLGELTDAVRAIAGSGNLSQHVPVATDDELSDLAHSFNQMVERLEQSTQNLSALNQEMEDLLRVVSHDLRAPLINIQGFAKRLDQLLKTPTPGAPERIQESMQFIFKSVEKMDTLLGSLLAISRVGRRADPIAPHDLDQILDDVLATLTHQLKEQQIELVRHPLPAQIPCRRNEINQVFSNLLSNAIKYMGACSTRQIEIGGAAHGEFAECYVRDTGIGITPADQERIFQLFTRLQTIDVPGEGIGLAYVRKILHAHGGTIRVVSEPGQGSTFIFTLPMAMRYTELSRQ
ncbi:MAG: HAMP domain-containing protein [Candidatus Omnitrophica bacterium]|nr:HAMP domain-containing protein [Candidatus Omnitrophota bacterium]